MTNSEPLVLVVDDDPDSSALLQRWLEVAGFRGKIFDSAEALLGALSQTLPDVICLDLGLPGLGGMDALGVIRRRHQTVPVVIVTAEDAVHTAVQAMQAGAYDFFTKPLERDRLLASVRKAADHHRLQSRVAELECEAQAGGFAGIVGQSSAMRRLFRQLHKVVASDITVMIHGESGTGKELVAQAVHSASARKLGEFVAVNCAAIPETLQDSEFFGHEKGAFTGAVNAKPGRFEQANGGTLFLDEVAELSPALQAKLLRVLQERKFHRVGGTRIVTSDFRLVAATHRDLRAMVREGSFREDLFYRVAILELSLPPLRDRSGDIPLLIQALLVALSKGNELPSVHRNALECLQRYPWPGNVRELRNVLERALVVTDSDCIEVEDLPEALQQGAVAAPFSVLKPSAAPASSFSPKGIATLPEKEMTLAQLERWAIETQMEKTDGNIAEVVRVLGIGRTTLYRKLKQYRLA